MTELFNHIEAYEDVHKLVYAAFNGELLPGEIIHHIDENKLNNWANNLLKVTATEHRRMHDRNLRPFYIDLSTIKQSLTL